MSVLCILTVIFKFQSIDSLFLSLYPSFCPIDDRFVGLEILNISTNNLLIIEYIFIYMHKNTPMDTDRYAHMHRKIMLSETYIKCG